MLRSFLFTTIIMVLIAPTASAQSIERLDELSPNMDFENIHVTKLDDDALSSTFMIWVKEHVKEHYHAEHTEVVYVLKGEGTMKLGDEWQAIAPGDYIFIPKGTPHAVKVKGEESLKVISIQSPHFDGTDRIFVSQE